jgi:hypothetical protein
MSKPIYDPATITWGAANHGMRLAAVIVAEPRWEDYQTILSPIKQRKFDIGEPVLVAFLTRNEGDTSLGYPGETPIVFAFEPDDSCCYIPHMEVPDGPPAITSYGRSMQGAGGSYCENELKPGEELCEVWPLNVIYDMTRLGEYRFAFSRPTRHFDTQTNLGAARSNDIAITVVDMIWNQWYRANKGRRE